MTDEGRPLLLGRPIPDSFPVTRLTIPPRSARVTEAELWAESLVVVHRGDVEVESAGGARETFHPGDVLCLEWVGARVVRNHGADEAEVVSIRRFGGDSDEGEPRMKFRTTIAGTGTNTAGIPVPDDVMAALNAGKKPAVTVKLGSHTYRSSVGTVDGGPMISLSAANRAAAGVAAGDEVEVEVELDTAPREVEVPADFAAALDAEPEARRTFDALSYSNKRWHVESVAGAKTDETRQRRIGKSVEALRQGRAR